MKHLIAACIVLAFASVSFSQDTEVITNEAGKRLIIIKGAPSTVRGTPAHWWNPPAPVVTNSAPVIHTNAPATNAPSVTKPTQPDAKKP
jgi:hypothetical protein